MSGDLLAALMAGAATSARYRAATQGAFVERAARARTPHGARFVEALRAPGFRIIAECKRRSPSKGVLRSSYDPAQIARGYERAGAAAVSVLTEPTLFDGSLADLDAVRRTVDIPLLRKDFISHPFQIVEALAAGADAVLLIVAGLEDAGLQTLLRQAESTGLAALVEVHTRTELARALDAGASVIGVNSRNLKTLEIDLALHEQLIAHIPSSLTAVAESGLTSGRDLHRLRTAGYHAFLIGERFMTVAEPGVALSELVQSAEGAV